MSEKATGQASHRPSETGLGDAETPLPSPAPARFKTTTVRETKPLNPAARRALAEAEERRRRHAAERVKPGDLPKELNGRDGPEPIRYGDWEKNGLISDF